MKDRLLLVCLAIVLGVEAVELDLSGTWKLTQVGSNEVTCAVAVPGGIYTALYEAKYIPDPYFAQNEKKTQWPGRVEWDFEHEFTVDDDFAGRKAVILRMEDVDCFADIYLNGIRVGETSNRFCRWDFDVKGALKPGRNTICGRFHSTEAISSAESTKYPKDRYRIANATVKQINLVRTVQCHGGWDWGITQMDTGFMGVVKLIAVDEARIDYVYTTQKFADDYSAADVEVTIEAFAPIPVDTEVCVKLGNSEKTKHVSLTSGTNRVSTVVRIEKPRLWWPNEAGDQPLYDLEVSLGDAAISKKLGLRKLEIVNDVDVVPDPVDGKKGRQMTVAVNGKRIFMKGADWIPCDAFENRQRGWFRQHLGDAKLSHMNMVRVWGGGQFEHSEFYEICDELGILVWHDLMFSCATYPGTDEFLSSVGREVRHQVKRLRDHPSIALWCGDNECLGAARWFSDKSKPEVYKENIRLCAERAKFLDAVCREADPTRTFWPSSPCLGPGNFGDGWKDDSSGDMHYWRVWFGGELFTKYHEIRPRFCSEFGFQSYPSVETALTYVDRSQLNPWAPDFFYHQKSPKGNRYIIETMMKYFRFPKDVKSVHYLSQVQQALAIKTGVEHFRSIMPRCMGAIYWQLCDNWPVASWSSIEYGGKWKHLQYHAKRFYAPSALTVKPASGDPDTLELWAMNDRDEPLDGEARLECWRLDGVIEESRAFALDVPARCAKRLGTMPLAEFGDAEARKGKFLTVNAPGCPDNEYLFDFYRESSFANAKVALEARDENGEWRVTVAADKPAFYVWVDAFGVKGLFSDDSFTLLPGRPKTISFRKRAGEGATFSDFKKSLEVMHLRESYE